MQEHQEQEWPLWIRLGVRLLSGFVMMGFFWFIGRHYGGRTTIHGGMVLGLVIGLACGERAIGAMLETWSSAGCPPR